MQQSFMTYMRSVPLPVWASSLYGWFSYGLLSEIGWHYGWLLVWLAVGWVVYERASRLAFVGLFLLGWFHPNSVFLQAIHLNYLDVWPVTAALMHIVSGAMGYILVVELWGKQMGRRLVVGGLILLYMVLPLDVWPVMALVQVALGYVAVSSVDEFIRQRALAEGILMSLVLIVILDRLLGYVQVVL